jgi:hypothetical protein
MRLLKIGIPVAALSGLLLFSPLKAQQPTPRYPHDQSMPQTGAAMDVNRMMADLKASDARLEALAAKMHTAQGEAKVMAIQDVVDDLVKNQIDMHRHMMMMHDRMMEAPQK